MQSQRLGASQASTDHRSSLYKVSQQVISHKEGVNMQFPISRSQRGKSVVRGKRAP